MFPPDPDHAARLPQRDAQLVQITEAVLADAAQRSGDWLACRSGCTQCCHGAFAINVLDAARLQRGMDELSFRDPERAAAVTARAEQWVREHESEFPGDRGSGVLGATPADEEAFEDFANDAPCPALDPATGLCDVYAFRPMTCRVFGPPVRVEGGALACCELCFVGATEDQIAACEMIPPHNVEESLLDEIGSSDQTVVAYALLKSAPASAR